VAGRGAHRARPAARRASDRYFLRSSGLADAIVADACVEAGDLVLDVGAGSGRLTKSLARTGARVRAIELDTELAQGLRERFAGAGNVRVLEADAVRVPLPAEPFRVVANLPFGSTSAILRRLLAAALTQADVIVQWEVARKRAAVVPSTALSLCWGARYELTVVRRIPAECFTPKPSVDAAVLRVVRRRAPLVDDVGGFEAAVRAAFARDRLAGLGPPQTLKRVGREVGFRRDARPRDLDLHQWAALFRALSRGGGPGNISNR
jgi:23S rRNA (adenine-N6)-dimethyltransferase